MHSLKDKNAFITGGTAGIGLAVGSAFVEAGATVTLAGRRDGDKIAADCGASFQKLDVTDEAAFEAALEACVSANGPLDVLVLNAGVVHEHMMADLPAADARLVLEVNVLGVFYGLKHAPSRMNDGGSIIITASNAAIVGSPEASIYSASKAAASQLARCAAIELGPRGIRVNAVSPGGTRTDMALPEQIFEDLTPLGRMATTDDLTGIYQLLASDAGRYINGQQIVVDGGMTAGVTLQTLGRIFA